MSARPLSEISEADAGPELSALYEDIKACLGVPVINLIFRNMATFPGCLEFVWGSIRPLYVSGEAARCQEALVAQILPGETAPWRRADLSRLGLLPADASSVVTVFETYIRANPANMVGLLCLKAKLTGPDTLDIGPALTDIGFRPAPLPPLLPMIPPDQMPDDAASAYRRLTEQLHGPDGAVNPSLYRHFAAWPALLTRIADQTEPLVGQRLTGEGQKMVASAEDMVRRLLPRLPDPDIARPDDSVVAHILDLATLFPPNMAKMTVLAEFLRRGLAVSEKADDAD